MEDSGEVLGGGTFGWPDRDAWFEEAGFVVEMREAVARAGDEFQELGDGVDEVEDLGDEQ